MKKLKSHFERASVMADDPENWPRLFSLFSKAMLNSTQR